MNIMPSDREKRWKQITDRFGISGGEPDSTSEGLQKALSGVLPENLSGLFKKKSDELETKKRDSATVK